MQYGNMQYGGMPMKWYKFLIYFGLFASAFSYFVMGIMYLTGGIYSSQGVNAEWVYRFAGSSLKTIDMLYGVACFALCAYSIVVRQKLANLQVGAPKALNTFYIVNGGATVVYCLLFMAVYTSTDQITSQIVSAILGMAISIAINNAYFSKRAHLFTR